MTFKLGSLEELRLGCGFLNRLALESFTQVSKQNHESC